MSYNENTKPRRNQIFRTRDALKTKNVIRVKGGSSLVAFGVTPPPYSL